MYTCTHEHKHTRTYTHAHVHTCTNIRAHTHMHTCTHEHSRARTYAHMHTCTHARVHSRAQTYAHMRTCTHARVLLFKIIHYGAMLTEIPMPVLSCCVPCRQRTRRRRMTPSCLTRRVAMSLGCPFLHMLFRGVCTPLATAPVALRGTLYSVLCARHCIASRCIHFLTLRVSWLAWRDLDSCILPVLWWCAAHPPNSVKL